MRVCYFLRRCNIPTLASHARRKCSRRAEPCAANCRAWRGFRVVSEGKDHANWIWHSGWSVVDPPFPGCNDWRVAVRPRTWREREYSGFSTYANVSLVQIPFSISLSLIIAGKITNVSIIDLSRVQHCLKWFHKINADEYIFFTLYFRYLRYKACSDKMVNDKFPTIIVIVSGQEFCFYQTSGKNNRCLCRKSYTKGDGRRESLIILAFRCCRTKQWTRRTRIGARA